MEQSEKIDAIAAALNLAQGMVEGAKKDSANPHFKSKYADLESVWFACREAVTSNGLAVIQSPGLTVDGAMHMTTLVTHSSGQWIKDTLSIPLGKSDAQGYGSAVTYARRYALSAFLGIAPEDDDGNAASRGPREAPAEQRLSDAQRAELMTLAEQSAADMRGFCTYYKIDALSELPASRFDHARAMLNKKLSEKAAANSSDDQREAA